MDGESSDERVIVLADWPQPAAGAPEPRILADDISLSIRYRTDNEAIAVIRFPLCNYLIFGAPNDEALGGHPLTNRGLTYYSVHEVHDSSLIHLLERRNSVHPRHDRRAFLEDKKHYIFTFQDSTLECVVNEGKWWKPIIAVCKTEEEADQAWKARKNP
jgi:hypothetical protein